MNIHVHDPVRFRVEPMDKKALRLEGDTLLVIRVEDVLEWLKAGRDDAEDIVDLPWSVKQIGGAHYVAEHPKMPFVLNVLLSGDFVRLVVPTGIETATLPLDERIKIYRILLLLNERINLLKFSLSGMNEEVTLCVDLDRKSLGKGEFNDALTALLVGLNEMVDALGISEEFQKAVFERIAAMIIDRLSKGATHDEIITFLVMKVGLSKGDAEELLTEIERSLKGSSDENWGYL